jgi:dephospho-CoA kinase
MPKFIVGLTGGIGSGKSTVTSIFETLSVDIVDADIVAREVVVKGSPALTAIKAYFGDDYITAEGLLNRALLRERIFSNPEDKAWLNALMHPLINQALHQQIAATTSPYCILVAPLLLENKLHEKTNTVLVVDVTEEEQIIRTVKRDNSNRQQIKAIIASQMQRAERLTFANYILDNSNTDLKKMQEDILKLHKDFLQLSSKSIN